MKGTYVKDVEWRRSSRCDNGNCVEMARIGDAFAMRDSKATGGPVLTFAPEGWEQFVADVRAGMFDVR